ncbi:MAG: glycosyl hydrolase family 18 protein [Bacillota bacterium]
MSTPVLQPSPYPPRKRGRSRSRAWLTAVLILILAAGAAFGGYQLGAARTAVPVWDPVWLRGYFDRPVDTSGPGQGFWVAGYWVDYDLESLRTLQQRSPHLDQVIAFSYGFAPDGSLQGKDPYVLRGVVARPKRILLFANLTDNDFSVDTVRLLLTDPAAQARSQQAMVAKAQEYGAAGIQLDFEGVPKELRSELTSYVRELATATRAQGLTLSMAVPAKVADSPNSDWSGAFDYPALGAILDEMYIMAYDEHYRLGPPGPVASLPWTERVIRYAISVVPTKKIVLGIPGYGYDWTTSSRPTSGGEADEGAAGGGAGRTGARTVTGRSADRLLSQAQAQVAWDPTMGENVAVYGSADQSHTVWFPDQRSLQAKLGLARQYNLKGVALWRLGLEPLTYWEPMAVWRQTPEEGSTPVTAPPSSQ